MDIEFSKTGRQIKKALQVRRANLKSRLDKRNAVLADFMKDTPKVRSYMIRNSKSQYYGHGRGEGTVLFGNDDISSEEKEEISQLCNRIFEIEQELHRLALIEAHLDDKQVVDLGLDDLISYGFGAQEGISMEESE